MGLGQSLHFIPMGTHQVFHLLPVTGTQCFQRDNMLLPLPLDPPPFHIQAALQAGQFLSLGCLGCLQGFSPAPQLLQLAGVGCLQLPHLLSHLVLNRAHLGLETFRLLLLCLQPLGQLVFFLQITVGYLGQSGLPPLCLLLAGLHL